METYAHFVSKQTDQGIKIFRHHTEFRSTNGSGKVIGLIVMMNPGNARPVDDVLFNRLENSEYETEEQVLTMPDNTMKKVMSMIQKAYKNNGITFPNQYSIHIENIFNIREKESDKAKRYAKSINGIDHLMFKCRELLNNYDFVFFAWGKLDIALERQKNLFDKYPQAIVVNRLNYKGTLMDVNYPVHPLYMNTEYFLEASKNKLNVRLIAEDANIL
ncbi:hypothetical protein HP548_07335 [Paenibacillus taichungensis]|uniref:DUF1643 domain-containing protein n=1 Tax=Paenibacillus taichungensis TaxID=484184 RepID=A0ABX2MJB8_9BACL|nr:hypothetical protein [Paenibacillus taichungensis]NUU53890.1 hypothetical protein [Paenibacillus taichungensis]